MVDTEQAITHLNASVQAGMDYYKTDPDAIVEYTKTVVTSHLAIVGKALSREIEQLHTPAEPLSTRNLFAIHYTGLPTLIALLNQRSRNLQSEQSAEPTSLRLYDAAHLNDPTEGVYLAGALPRKHRWVGVPKQSHAYIVSFIGEHQGDPPAEDNLVFWRMYGKEGEGCSMRVNIPPTKLRRVFYGKKEAEQTSRTLISLLDILKPLSALGKALRETLAECFWDSIGRVPYLYKSNAYSYEDEYRLVVRKSDINDNNILFEVANGSLSYVKSYCEPEDLSIPDLMVENMMITGSRVTLGPRVPNPEALLQSLEILIRKAGLQDGLKVKTSQIAYRKF